MTQLTFIIADDHPLFRGAMRQALEGMGQPATIIEAGDLDLAQDYGVCVALDDKLDQPLLEILKTVDPSFAPVPTLDARRSHSDRDSPGPRHRM